MLKLVRAYQALNVMRDIVGQDLLNATYWMDARRAHKADVRLSPAADAVLSEFRKTVPLRRPAGDQPMLTSGTLAADFLKSHTAGQFFPGGPAMPATMPRPRAERSAAP
jgi:histidine ammonia-lyase